MLGTGDGEPTLDGHATATYRNEPRQEKSGGGGAATLAGAVARCKLAPTSRARSLDSVREALADRYASSGNWARGMATVFLAEDLKHIDR